MFSLFGWTEGRFEFTQEPVACERTIKKGRMEIILDGLRLLDDGNEREAALSAVRRGDTLRIIPGERFPTDCRIASGCATIDQQVVTGESTPVEKTAGGEVFAGVNEMAGRYAGGRPFSAGYSECVFKAFIVVKRSSSLYYR